MALKKINDDNDATGRAASPGGAEPPASDEAALCAFQASATALALIEAFARVTAHRIVADARAARRRGDDEINHS